MTNAQELLLNLPLIQQAAKNANVKKYDVIGTQTEDSSVKVREGKVDQAKSSQRNQCMLRVWNAENQVGVASTNNFSTSSLEHTFRMALDVAKLNPNIDAVDFSPEALSPLAPIEDQQGTFVSISEMAERLLSLEKRALNYHPAIQSVPYNTLGQKQSTRFYLNSDGASRTQTYTAAFCYIYARAQESGRKPRSAGHMVQAQEVASLNFDECLETACGKTVSHLAYESIPSGQYPVLFSPEAFLDLLSAFSNFFNAQNVLDKQSLCTPSSLNQPLASTLLSLWDDARHPNCIPKDAFDDEGTPTKAVQLLDKGTLVSWIHSSVTARKMNSQVTGHANVGAKITASPHYLVVGTSHGSQSLSLPEKYIYVDSLQALHAGVQATQGSFSLPFDGWLFQGSSKKSVESATVAGDFFTALRAVCGIGSSCIHTPSGSSPEVFISQLAVTGG